ncbi:hypothetical protein R3P38DRAFT_3207375 [Favolaschia claudopus]|uniref:Transcription activator GCR1-like domain-containing protein n=1 Tax=Favolaschia claudopus TaxID=2862362 RepID=A0AAW0ALM4_9AGAR
MAGQASVLHVIPYHGPPSHLESKRRRFRVKTTTTTQLSRPLPPLPNPPYCFNNMDEVVERPSAATCLPPAAAANSGPSPSQPIATLQDSLTQLDARTYSSRQRLVETQQEKKATAENYERHYKHYLSWWDLDQARLRMENPTYVLIPALPITAAKAAAFVEYETIRPQRKKLSDGTPSTSTCGRHHVSQVISALESYRLNNEHHYPNNTDAQKGLRTDNRIKTLETSAKSNEPERVKKLHALKAVGTRADTFVETQLEKVSLSQLTDFSGPMNLWRTQRDRAMNLMSCGTAFRGDSTRSLLWSDTGAYDVPILAKGRGEKVKALILRADQSKVNTDGHVDEHGALRHVNVVVCPIGAIALYFFVHFHVIGAPAPDFTPQFDEPGYGEYGKRDWYGLHIFSTAKDCTREMSYQAHRNAVKKHNEANDIVISKATHAGRGYTAKNARENGASVTAVKALGRWSDSGSYHCYDQALPLEALLAAAGFDGNRPENHFIAREVLAPPEDVVEALFTFVEPELRKLAERRAQKREAEDYALRQFLELFVWLRVVLVQDAALLFTACPNAPIFQYPPFDSLSFRAFARTAAHTIQQAEEAATMQLKNLPQNVANTFSGIVKNLNMQQQIQHDKLYSLLRRRVVEDSEPPQKRRRTTYDTFSYSLPDSTLASQPSETALLPSTRPNLPLLAPSPSSETSIVLPFDEHSMNLGLDFDFELPPMASAPQWSPEQQAALAYLNSPPQPSGDSSTSPLFILASQPPLPSSPSPQTNLPSPLHHPPPLLHQSDGSKTPMSQVQVDEWCRLAHRFGEDCIRRHTWGSPSTKNKRKKTQHILIPYYELQPVSKILDFWTEYSAGWNGHISIRALDEGWGSDWRWGNRTAGTEYCRRSKVWKLVEQLKAKRNWDTELAQRFIRQTYQEARTTAGALRFPTARSFCEWLQAKGEDGTTGSEIALRDSNGFSQ